VTTNRQSYWAPDTTDNLVWFNNKGGGLSGEWSICQGASQSYSSANGSLDASAPQQFTGSLANEASVNALTSQACSGTSCGIHLLSYTIASSLAQQPYAWIQVPSSDR
jgi:hypothetical protein